MSNTTFDAKQAVKYMLDGFDCIDNTGRVFSINAYYLYVDKEYIDGQFARFLTILSENPLPLGGGCKRFFSCIKIYHIVYICHHLLLRTKLMETSGGSGW